MFLDLTQIVDDALLLKILLWDTVRDD